MTGQVVEAVLLWLGVGVLVGCAAGVVRGRVADRLHYAALGSMVGLPLVLVSQCVATPSNTPQLLAVIGLQVIGAPALTVATARAAHREQS